MATRFYLLNSGAAPVSPPFGAEWEQTGQADRVLLTPKLFADTLTALTDKTVTVPITTSQQVLNRQFVSAPLSITGIIPAGLISVVIRCTESATTANAFLYTVARIVSNDGQTSRGNLFAGATDTEFPTVTATRINAGGATSSVTAQRGDRLVIEIGVDAQAPTAATTGTHRFGNNAASDFALTTALTTDLNPWVEFSVNFYSGLSNNYQSVRVGDGMSTTERIR